MARTVGLVFEEDVVAIEASEEVKPQVPEEDKPQVPEEEPKKGRKKKEA